MKLKRSLMIATLLGGIAVTSPAFAQESRDREFSGLYVGASGGYDVQGSDIGSRINFDRNGDGVPDVVRTSTGADAFSTGFCNGKARGLAIEANGGCENDRNRGSYYGRVGYDVQRGNIVVGVLGEFGRTDITDYVSAFSTTPANYVMSRSIDWEASGRLRAGYAINGGLFYGTGGVGYARIDHNFTTSNTQNAFTTIENDRDKFGFIVGGGVEYKIAGPFTIGVEYTYHDYKDGQYKVLATRGTAPATNPFVLPPNTAGTVFQRSDDNFRWHSIRATVGFHF